MLAYKCEECDCISDEFGGKFYECRDCLITFTEENSSDNGPARCPDCGQSGSVLADRSCLECESGAVQEVDATFCEECNYLVETTLLKEHNKEHVSSAV